MKKVFILVCFLMVSSILLAGEVFHVEESAILKEDLVLIGKSCVMDGTVNGDAVIINGDLELHGTVNGDAVVLGGNAKLCKESHVKGDMVAVGGKVEKEEGAIVDGNVVMTDIGPLKHLFKLIPGVASLPGGTSGIKIEKHYKTGFPKSYLMLLVWGIALSIFIMLFTIIFPSSSETMTLYLEKRPGRAFFTGLLGQILFIPAILFLVLSIIGILLVPFFVIAYPIALLIGLTAPSLFIAKRITGDVSFFHNRNHFLSFMGLFILFIVFFVGEWLRIGGSALTVLGTVISILTIFIFYLYFTFGLGCLILSKLGTRKP